MGNHPCLFYMSSGDQTVPLANNTLAYRIPAALYVFYLQVQLKTVFPRPVAGAKSILPTSNNKSICGWVVVVGGGGSGCARL